MKKTWANGILIFLWALCNLKFDIYNGIGHLQCCMGMWELGGMHSSLEQPGIEPVGPRSTTGLIGLVGLLWLLRLGKLRYRDEPLFYRAHFISLSLSLSSPLCVCVCGGGGGGGGCSSGGI